MENEIWKDIKGYEGLYQVNKIGQVRKLKHEIKILAPEVMKKGYLRVSLTKNKQRTRILIHVIVAKHFIPNHDNKQQVNHINGIKSDNRIENLEWCTNKENCIHAVKNNLRLAVFGEEAGGSKLSEIDVIEIRNLKGKLIKKEIAEKFNISIHTIKQIHQNISWKHLLKH